jgi:hypothetical protein
MQSSFVALAAALAGIVPEMRGEGISFLSIIGDALTRGAFIVVVTAFSSSPQGSVPFLGC